MRIRAGLVVEGVLLRRDSGGSAVRFFHREIAKTLRTAKTQRKTHKCLIFASLRLRNSALRRGSAETAKTAPVSGYPICKT